MPSSSIVRKSVKMVSRGINLSLPVDSIPTGYFPYMNNMNFNQQGELEVRPGSALFETLSAAPVHSARRLNNEIPSAAVATLRLFGNGTLLYGDTTQIDSGYSGNPLSLIPFRPEQSPEPWMYVSDQNKNRKVRTDGTVQGVGILPPLASPDITEAVPPYFLNVDMNNPWTAGGTASAMAGVTRVPAGTTIGVVKFDVGSTGWLVATIVSTSYAWLQPHEVIFIAGHTTPADGPIVEEVHTAISTTTIASIDYDSGTTGPCSIVLTAQTPGLDRNSMLLLNGTETVRVLSVSIGPNGIFSFRCSTTGTFSAGQSVAGTVSIRCYCNFNFANGSAVAGVSDTFTVTKGIGTQTKTLAVDLSILNLRALQNDDYIHISAAFDKPQNITEGRIALDIDSTTNDFTRNYYYKAFRPDDLTPAITSQLSSVTTAQNVLANQTYDSVDATAGGSAVQNQIDTSNLYDDNGDLIVSPDVNPSPTAPNASQQLATGGSQFTELTIRISDLVRVGGDLTRSLANVQAIRLQLTVIDTVVAIFDSWWVGGTFGPDVIPGSPTGIMYRYRYRSSLTGARSNPSPAPRYQMFPNRQQLDVTMVSSSDPQVDLIDIERYDPNLQVTGAPAVWVVVGTVPNSSPLLHDQAVSNIVAGNLGLETDRFQPWPILKPPLSGTVNVSGTNMKWVSGDKFPTNLTPGTIITIGAPGQSTAYQSHRFPNSDQFIELELSAGTGAAIPFQITSPVVVGQPLPVVFGVLEGPLASFVFALGDVGNPGTLYWTNGNDPDSASDKNTIEITSPSEPLVGGVVWNTLVYVFSRERVFILRPSFDANGNFQFTFYAIPAPSGLWSSWALCAGYDAVYFLGRDGIYQISGETTASVTDETLYPLFPHQGEIGVGTLDYEAIDMTQYTRLRLSFVEGDIYFNYIDIDGHIFTFRYDTTAKGWFPHTYPSGVIYQYWEETPPNVQPNLLLTTVGGKVLTAGGTTDEGADIIGVFRTPSYDNGDPRSQKLYPTVMTDMQGTGTIALGFNDNTVVLPAVALGSPGVRGEALTNLASITNLALYRNICAQYTMKYGTRIYEFEPSYYLQPYLGTSYISRGDQGFPDWQLARNGVFAVISTADVTLQVDIDGRLYTYTLANTTGNLRKVYLQFEHGSKGRMFIWQLTSSAPFAFFAGETMVRLKDWRGSLQEVRPFAEAA